MVLCTCITCVYCIFYSFDFRLLTDYWISLGKTVTLLQAAWTSETLQPIQTFFEYMSSNMKDSRVVTTLEHINAIVSHDRNTPARVSEAVAFLHGSLEKTQHDDGGLAAVFLGISQGKTFLMDANASAQTGQKEIVHLKDLTDAISEILDFAEKMPEPTSSDFQWEQGLKKGGNAMEALCNAVSRASTQPSRTVVQDAKKKLSDFACAFAKAYVTGPAQTWVKSAARKYEESKTVVPVPDIVMNKWASFPSAKFLSGLSACHCKTAIETCEIMKQISSGLTSAAVDDSSSSTAILVNLGDSMDSFKNQGLEIIAKYGLFDDAGEAAFASIRGAVAALSQNHVDATVKSVLQQMGDVMAKVRQLKCYKLTSYNVSVSD